MARPAPVDEPDESDLSVRAPERAAAGLPAVRSSLRHVRRQLGLARGVRALRVLNQPDGFDCPGCAWPEPGHTHRAEFCENGVKAVAEEATNRRAGPELFARHSLAELAERSDWWLGQQGRLTRPLLLDEGADRYAPVAWDDAFELIAGELGGLASPDEAAFYTSGRTSNEAAFLYQLFVRALGTNNLPDCSNMCHESSGVALSETIGIGKGTVTLEDVHRAGLIVVVGQNPGTNHPRMLTALETARRNGARIVAVNPLPEAGLLRFRNPQRPIGLLGKGTDLADLYVQIRPNGDLALFQALGRLLVEEDDRTGGRVLDHAFLAAHADGLDAYREHVRALPWDALDEATGVPRAQVEQLARLTIAADGVIVCWAMGLTQHRDAVATIREIVNYLLLRGNVGRPGAGPCPVRGHSNVQGDRTMGITEQPHPAFLETLGRAFRFSPPAGHGLDVVESIRAMRDGRVRVFMAMGGNFLAAAPDTEATADALRRCRLTVQVSTKLNRSHLVTGRRALILPTLGRTERDVRASGPQLVTVEDSMGVVHGSAGVLAPASDELRSEVAIVCELARRVVGDRAVVPWQAFAEDYGLVRDAIAQVVPGFEDFDERVRRPGGFTLPNPVRDARRFDTVTGRARLTVNALDVLAVPPGRLVLQTMRSHDQYNTTVYGLDDRYRGIEGGRRIVLANPDDLALLGIEDGDEVDLVSEWSDGERRAPAFRVVAYPLAPRSAAAYFPEANPLVPLDSTAVGSNTPTSKGVIVRLERTASPAHLR